MNTQTKPAAVPFFARDQKAVTVRTGLQAGLTESRVKAREQEGKV